MTDQSPTPKGKRRLWVPVGIAAGLMLMGALAFAGGQHVLHLTNSVEFCISCHEMRDNNYQEYKTTIHAVNRTGVQATCSDCHVPHEFPDVLVRKVLAVSDIYHHIMGTVDTKEKFLEHKLDLAKRVWRRMKETDSRECRNCHSVQAMDATVQGKVAQRQHQKLRSGEATCIDCHFGIAHKEPPGGVEPQDVMGQASPPPKAPTS
jgi:cytochrome c-type protein NapC